MNLLLLEPNDIDEVGLVRLNGERARHLLTVLRVVPDQRVRVGVIDGPTGIGRVTAVSDNTVSLSCTFDDAPGPPPVDLLLALPRPKVLRRLWAQIAALGVSRIILTNAERVERNYFDTHLLEPRGYRPLLIEGLQQARDTRVPLVTIHRQFRVLIEDELEGLSPDSLRIVADPAAPRGRTEGASVEIGSLTPGETRGQTPAARSMASVVMTRPGARVLLAIGPEGGWNDFELQLLRTHRFESVDMGARTLRSDTACIALLALVHDALGHRTWAGGTD